LEVKCGPFTVCSRRPLLAINGEDEITTIAMKCTAERAALCGCDEWRDAWVTFQPETICPKNSNGVVCIHGSRAEIVFRLERLRFPSLTVVA